MSFGGKWGYRQIMIRCLILCVGMLGCLLVTPVRGAAESNLDTGSSETVERATAQNAQWLMRQPDSSYTLQLITVSSRSQLKAFFDRAAPRVVEPLASFRYQKQNGLLYVMVLGIFTTAEEAFEAQRELQIDGLTAKDTWVRSLADVKRSIRTTLQI